MENIINKIPREAILNELNKNTYVRKVNNGDNEIYIITHHNSPHTMQEIGRLRMNNEHLREVNALGAEVFGRGRKARADAVADQPRQQRCLGDEHRSLR